MATLIDRDYMLLQIEKAKAENRTFDYDSLIDFVNALPTVDKSTELEEIKSEIIKKVRVFETSFGDLYSMDNLLFYIKQIIDNHIKELEQ